MKELDLFQIVEGHLLEDARPSVYLESAAERNEFENHPFSMLLKLKGSPQPPKYHPEGDAWNHTMMVVDEAAQRKAQSGDARTLMWAALLHDLGKPGTTKIKNGKIISYGHDALGAKLAREFLLFFGCDETFIDGVVTLVQWHMQILYFENKLPFFKEQELRQKADMQEVGLLSLCDRIGRKDSDEQQEQKKVERFVKKIEGEA